MSDEPIEQKDEDEAGAVWQRGIAREWADELADPREDIYTDTDGEPVSGQDSSPTT